MAVGEGDEIAEVFITIRPRTTGFKQEAEAELEKNRPEVKADVTPKLDKSKLATLKAELDAFGKDVEKIKIDVADKEAVAKLAKFQAEYSAIAKKLNTTARLDLAGQDRVLAQIAAARAAADAWGHKRETAHLDLDTSNFDRNIDKARGGVSRIRQGLDDLKGGIDRLDFNVNDKKAFAEMKAIQAEFAKLSHASANAKLGVVGEAELEAKVAAAAARVDAFGHKHATATIDVNDRGSHKVEAAGGVFNKLIQIAGAVAPALIPIGATALGVSGQIVTSLGAAGAGFGAFGIAVAGASKIIQNDLKAIQKSQLAVESAQAAVDSAKGPKARAAALGKLKIAQDNYKKTLDSMAPSERHVVNDTNKIVIAFTAWERAAGLPAIAKVADHVMPVLRDLFRIMTPLVNQTADAFVILEKRADKSLNGAFGKRFEAFLAGHAKNDILVWARALANIGKGFAGILLAFAPFDKQFGRGLDNLTGKFAHWGATLGDSKGFKSFFKYFQQSAPVVGQLLSSMAQAFVQITKALKGVGLLELKIITNDFSDLVQIAKNNPVLFNMALALLAVAKGMKSIKLLAIAAALQPILKFAEAHPAIAAVALSVLALAKGVAALKTASLGLSLAKLAASIGGAGAAGVAGSAAAGAAGSAAGGAVAAGEGAAAGGIGARLAAILRGSSVGRLGSGAAGLFGGGAVGAAAIGSALGLVIIPLIASYLNKNFVPQGSHLLDDRGTHKVTAPDGSQVDVPIIPHPARGGGGAGGRQRALDRAASSFVAPPTITAKTYFAAPPILGPSSGLKKDGKGYALEGQVAIQASLSNSFKSAGKKAKQQFDASFYGNEGNKSSKVPKSQLPDSGTVVLPPPKVKVGVDAAAATTAILRVQKLIGEIPKNRNIKLGTPGAKDTQQAIDNVYLAQHHLPGEKRIKVSAPGGDLSALTLVNVGRAAKNLKPIAKVNVSAPGATGARQSINNLLHASGLLPKNKNIVTNTPGARAAILSFINLDRQAHGLPALKRIPTSAPGADAAIQLMISLAKRAGILPKDKHINTDAPGAQNAINHINTLLIRAGLLPKGKSIPTSVPGAQDSILHYINLYNRAHNLPAFKKIPTSAPGAPTSIQQMIALATKIGLVPKNHSTNIYTPGYAQAHGNVISMKTALDSMPKTVNIAMKVIGTASDVLSKGLGFASGGRIPGQAPHPKADNVLIRATPGEFMQQVAAVRREGVPAMQALNEGRARIVPRYADGGTVLDVNMTGPNVASMKSGIRGFLNQSGKNINADQVKHIKQELASLSSGGGGGGAGRWLGVIAEALALLHQPVGLAGLFDRVVAGESGGNPAAINLSDSNARAGHPSVGLAQVIRGTFDAFAGPFRNVGPFLAGVSINPLANIFAGLNYGIQTYGSVAGIPGIASELHGGGYRPYADGGLIEGLHSGGPVQGIKRGASGEWVKALAVQAKQLRGAFHQGSLSGSLLSELSNDWPNNEPHHLAHINRVNPIVKRLVAYLWGRHGKKTTMDDALGHFNHGPNAMGFLDIMRAYDAGKSAILEFKGKGKGRHRFIPDSTTVPFRAGLRRYESLYHHDVQALEHRLGFHPENGQWTAALDGPVKHAIAHALGKQHSPFLPRPWSPLTPVEKALQSALTANKQSAEFRRDQDLFGKWNLVDLVQTLAGEDIATALPIARSAAKNRAMATKLNAAYRVADTSTLGGHFVNNGYLSGGKGFARFASGGRPKPGWAWAGEYGPELVKFRGTEQVYPARESAQMAGAHAHTSRDAPLIGHATFTDNTSVELQLRRAAFIEQQVR